MPRATVKFRLTNRQRDKVEKNIGLIKKEASNPKFTRMEFDDRVQEGSIALAKAVKKYDKTRGTKLSTYATHAIRNRLLQARRCTTLIHIPHYVQGSDNSMPYAPFAKQAAQPISIHSCDEETLDILAEDGDEPDPTVVAILEDVRRAMKNLSEIERAVVVGIEFGGQNSRVVGEKLGISDSVARRHKKNAFDKLRRELAAYA